MGSATFDEQYDDGHGSVLTCMDVTLNTLYGKFTELVLNVCEIKHFRKSGIEHFSFIVVVVGFYDSFLTS